MEQRLPIVVFVAGAPPRAKKPERWLAAAHLAAAQDLLARSLADPACGRCFVVTDDPEVRGTFAQWPVTVVAGPEPFHFGRALTDLVEREGLEAVLYVSGGAGALLPAGFVGDVAARLAPGRVVTNNRFSCDLAAVAPATALLRTRSVDRDNNLAWALAHEAGLAVDELPRDLSTVYDLDSPLDLLVLRLAGEPGPALGRCLAGLPYDDAWLRRAARPFADPSAEVTIAGRVATETLAALDRDAACRKRVLIEERGLEASGRGASGLARSLLAHLLDVIGPGPLFARLAETSAAAFVDTRLLLTVGRRPADRGDRFAADLLLVDQVGEPWLRALVAAARTAPLPVVLGGHTLVNGGVRLLSAWSWRQNALDGGGASKLLFRSG